MGLEEIRGRGRDRDQNTSDIPVMLKKLSKKSGLKYLEGEFIPEIGFNGDQFSSLLHFNYHRHAHTIIILFSFNISFMNSFLFDLNGVTTLPYTLQGVASSITRFAGKYEEKKS